MAYQADQDAKVIPFPFDYRMTRNRLAADGWAEPRPRAAQGALSREDGERQMPAGWWLLPSALLGAFMWVVILKGLFF